jgi:membrane protease YdiL (CAAX protease family)
LAIRYNEREDALLTVSRRLSAAAAAIPVGWLAATMLGHRLGLGLTITVASIAMAIAGIGLLPSLIRSLLMPSLRLILIGLVAGLVMVAATYLLFPVVTSLFPPALYATKSLYFLIPPRTTLPIVVIVWIIILAEEILWRGVVQEAISQANAIDWRGRPSYGKASVRGGLVVLASALVYGLSHTPIGSPLLVVVAVCCGVYWSALRRQTGSLIPSLISHLLWDTAVLMHRLVVLP